MNGFLDIYYLSPLLLQCIVLKSDLNNDIIENSVCIPTYLGTKVFK